MIRNIAVLGSTGSIGTQTLEIVREKPGEFNVTALAAGKNVDLIEAQIREFKPRVAALYDEKAAAELKVRVADTDTVVYTGMDGLLEVSTEADAQILVTGIVGMIGIQPTIAAIKAGKTIALANKETLVTAGHIIMPLAAQMGVSILPVDSEHSAIFQSLQGNKHEQVEKILLTASGGPFRGKKREELENVDLAAVLNHPNWVMGKKVTIDSASLCNKGLEVMEAAWLFDVDLDMIQVLIHPQSILHSAVQYTDGAVMGQLGTPDMKLPIQYALTYPDREYLGGKRVDLFELQALTFEKPDTDTFRGLALAYRAARTGGSLPTVFNAANEMAVKLLLGGQIRFLQIPDIIEEAMDRHRVVAAPDVETILAAEAEVYRVITEKYGL